MHYVRGIESAPHADLEHDRADVAAREVEQPHRRRDLEEREAAFLAAQVFGLDPIDGLADVVDQRDNLVRRRRRAVDREPLFQAVQVGRGVEPGAHARGG